jgi:hypothetical protein
MSLNRLSLGSPPRHDVEAAARLYLEYDRAGLLSEDAAQMFAMMVEDFEAVYRRAVAMKKGRQGE